MSLWSLCTARFIRSVNKLIFIVLLFKNSLFFKKSMNSSWFLNILQDVWGVNKMILEFEVDRGNKTESYITAVTSNPIHPKYPGPGYEQVGALQAFIRSIFYISCLISDFLEEIAVHWKMIHSGSNIFELKSYSTPEVVVSCRKSQVLMSEEKLKFYGGIGKVQIAFFISRFHTKPDTFFFQFEQFSQNGCFPLKLGNAIFIELRGES